MTDNGTVQLIDYLRAVRRRWPVVVLLAVLATGTALALSLTGTKKYDATAQLLFSPENQVDQLINPDSSRPADPERELNTAVELITLDVVAQAVRQRLDLEVTDEELLEQVETEISNTSNIVSLTVRDEDPARAAALANAFAEEYVAYRRKSAQSVLDDAAAVAESEYQALSTEEQASAEGQQLRARGRQLKITAALQTGGVEIVREARRPTEPSRPRPKLSSVLGLGLGLLLGFVAALALEFTDRRLRKEEDIEELFDLPVLASIPPPPRRGGESHAEREAFGLLAANLRFSTFESETNVLMVTSPGPAEGKTSVTLGLARALARLGVRVIAIEADLRRPTFSHKAPLGPSAGLTGLLTRPGPLAPQLVWLDAATLLPVTPDNVKDGLTFAVLPAGEIPPHPQRLLSRPTMGSVVDQARSLADAVLIDTPPIGSVNDAVTLASVVDSAVVVARLDETTRDAARRALRGLHNLDVTLAGLVVTGAEGGRHDYYQSADEPPARSRRKVRQS